MIDKSYTFYDEAAELIEECNKQINYSQALSAMFSGKLKLAAESLHNTYF